MRQDDKKPSAERWTPEHDALLRQHYPTMDAPGLAALLGRTVTAIYVRANKLGLAREHGRGKPQQNPRQCDPTSLLSRLAALVEAQGESGLTLDDACSHFQGRPRLELNQRLNRLLGTGRAVKVGGGKVHSPRFFASEALRSAWLAKNPGQGGAAARVLARSPLKRMAAEKAPDQPRGVACLPGEGKRTARTRCIEVPRGLARYEVADQPVEGGLRTHGIGNYLEPASGWAAALVGGRP